MRDEVKMFYKVVSMIVESYFHRGFNAAVEAILVFFSAAIISEIDISINWQTRPSPRQSTHRCY